MNVTVVDLEVYGSDLESGDEWNGRTVVNIHPDRHTVQVGVRSLLSDGRLTSDVIMGDLKVKVRRPILQPATPAPAKAAKKVAKARKKTAKD